jgi:hypothetical protein
MQEELGGSPPALTYEVEVWAPIQRLRAWRQRREKPGTLCENKAIIAQFLEVDIPPAW